MHHFQKCRTLMLCTFGPVSQFFQNCSLKKIWHENYKNFRQEVHIKISLNHYRPFHFWKLKFSGLSANILSEIRIFSSKYLKMKGSISSYLRVRIFIPYITYIIYDIPSIFHNMLPELKTFNFIQEWLGMELGTFVMCQISKMHFSHAFPHSWKALSHKTLLKIYSLIRPTCNPL